MEDARDRVVRLVGRAWDQAKSPLYRNAFFIMITSVVGNGLGFFFWIVLSNRYQTVDIGAAIALFATLSFLGALGLLGQGTGLVRYLPEAEDKGALVNTALTVTGLLCLGLSVIFLVVGVPVFLPELSFVLRDPLYVLTIVVSTVTLGVAPILDQAAIAVRRADLQTWRNTTFAVLKIYFALIIVSVLSGRAGVFLSLTLAWSVSVLVLGFALLPRALPGYVPRPQLRIQALRPMLRFSLGNYVAAVIGAGASSLPLPLIYVVLGSNAGPTNAAYFYVASIVAGLLFIIPGAVFTSFYAEASHAETNRRDAERKATLLSLGLLVPAIGVMFAFSETMLRLFGDPLYAREAITPLRILTFASIPVFLNSILGTRVRIRKRTLPLIVAETFIAIPGGSFQSIGLGLHILLVFTLMFLSVLLQSKDATLAALVVAASLASLVRVFSLAVPRYPFVEIPETNPLNTLPWLALVSVPLLVSVATVAYVQGLRPRDLGLRFERWIDIPQQTAVAMTGIPLGLLEFFILRPSASQNWIREMTLGSLVFGGLAIFFATRLSEGLIFPPILL